MRERLRKALVILATLATAIAGPNFTAQPAAAVGNYEFTSWTFTPCGAVGSTGPTLTLCQTAYATSSFEDNTAYFNVNAKSNQYWTAPVAGRYTFEIAGAAGGGTNGGKGMVYQFTRTMSATTYTCMTIGQKGVAATNFPETGGGGGSTLITFDQATVSTANCGGSVTAGGGGGGGTTLGKDASTDWYYGGSYYHTRATAGDGTNAGAATTDNSNINTNCGAKGGPLTGGSGGSGCTSAGNTAIGVPAQIQTTVGGMLGSGGGSWTNVGLGGDGGFPNGGATCGCLTNGGGGGGGGLGGGGGGINADGTTGGGGGGNSTYFSLDATSPLGQFMSLGAINAGDGYVKVTLESSPSTTTPAIATTTGGWRVGSVASAPIHTLPNLTGTVTRNYKWQINTVIGSSAGVAPWVDLANSNAQSLTIPAAAAGYFLRAVEIITDVDGQNWYFISQSSTTQISYTHSITTTPPDGAVGSAYFMAMKSGPHAYNNTGWSVSSGTLPAGITLGATTGNLSGTPTTAGTYTFTLSRDNGYEVASSTFTVNIVAAPVFSPAPAVNISAVTEEAFSYQFSATHASGPVTYSVSSGALPDGVTLDASTGLISGTMPRKTGSGTYPYSFKIRASVSTNVYADTATINVNMTVKTASGVATVSNPTMSAWSDAAPPTASIPFTPAAVGSGNYTYSTSTPNMCRITSDGVSSPITVTALRGGGYCYIELKQLGNSMYASNNQTISWLINGATQAALTSFTYSGSGVWNYGIPGATASTTGGSGSGAITWSSTTNTRCLIDALTGQITVIAPGGCDVRATKAADDFYLSTTRNQTFITTATEQITPVSFTNMPTTIDYSTPLTLAASGGDFTVGSSKSYSFTSSTTSVCTVASSTGVVTVKLTGTCTISVNATANGVYLAGTPTTASFTITGIDQAPLTISHGNIFYFPSQPNWSYDTGGGSGTGANSVVVDPSSSSICTVTASGSTGTIKSLGAGNCVFSITKAGTSNYNSITQQFTVPIDKGNQATVTTTSSPSSMTFNPNTPATTTVTATGGSGTGAFNYAVDPGSASICSVGLTSGVVTALGGGSCVVRGYRLTDTNWKESTGGTVTITIAKAAQATLTVVPSRTTLTNSDSTALTLSSSGGSGSGAVTFATSTTTICTVDANTGIVTAKAVGNCSVTATKATDANYLAATSASVTITVSKLSQSGFTATSTTTSTTFGSGTFTVSTSGGGGTGAVTYASSNTAICTVNSTSGVTTIVAVGSCVITATKAADTNYFSGTASVTITIAKGTQATFTATSTKLTATIGATSGITVSASGGTGTATITYASADTGICTVASNGVVTVLTAGTCSITATKPGGTSYNDATSTVNIVISKTSQATLSATANFTTGSYNDGVAYTVTATGGTSGLAIIYSSNSASVCAVNASTGAVTILTAGTCSITATRPGGASYSDASANATITIAKINQGTVVVTADNTILDYVDNPKATAQVGYSGANSTGAVTYSTTTPLVCSVDGSGLVTNISAGRCTVTVSIAADDNYNAATGSVLIRFGKVAQTAVTASSTISSTTLTAGASITVSLTGGSGVGAVSFSTTSTTCSVNSSTGTVTLLGAGDCVIRATKASDLDYLVASDTVTISVAKGTQTSLNVSSNRTTTTYGAGHSITVTATSGSGTGAVSFSTASTACAVNSATGVVTILGAGNCVITATKAADANYEVTDGTVTITVSKGSQATVTATPASQTLTLGDGSTVVIAINGGSGTGSISFSSSNTAVCTVDPNTGEVAIIAAGSCVITSTKAADANYLAASATSTLTVNKATQATLTATKTSDTTFGNSTVVTAAAAGGSGTGTLSFASTTSGVCTVNASTGVITIVSAGSCVIRATKAADTNYLVATSDVTITIAKASQSAVTTSTTYSNTTYGDGSINVATLSGGTGFGAVTFSSTDTSVCTVNSTTGAITVVTAGTCAITATKSGDTNFLTASAGATVTIAKAAQAALSASGSSSSTTFGNSSPITINTSGGSGTGAISYSSNTSSVCSVNASTGVIAIITAGNCEIKVTRAASTNYNQATTTATVSIAKANQATITATANDNSVTYGDGTALRVGYTGGSGTGLFSYASVNTAVCSIDSNGDVTVLTAGTCSITVTRSGDINYNERTATATISITKAAQVQLSASANDLVFTPAHPTTQIALSGGTGTGNLSYTVSANSAGICSVSIGGLVTSLQAGDCVINILKDADTNYLAINTSVTVRIAKGIQAALAPSGDTQITYSEPVAATSQILITGGTGNGSTSYSINNASIGVCNVSANGLIAALTAGTCVVNITKGGDAYYTDASATFTLNIAKAAQATIAGRSSKALVFNPTTPATATLSIIGGSGTGSVTYSTASSTCTVAATTVTAKGAGTCVVDIAKASDTKFLAATATLNIEIAKAAQATLSASAAVTALEFNPNTNSTTTVSVTGGSGTGAVSWSVDAGSQGVCSVNFASNPVVVTALRAGNCVVNVIKAPDANYLVGNGSVTISITKIKQAALVLSASKLEGVKGESVQLSLAGGTGDGLVTYTLVSGANVCGISGTTVNFVDGGDCEIRASKAGGNDYIPAESNLLKLTVIRANQTPLTLTLAAGALPNVAIGGKDSTTLVVGGGDGTGPIQITSATGCTAIATGKNVTVKAGTTPGSCQIQITKKGDGDFNDASYIHSLTVLTLPGAAAIETPILKTDVTTDGFLVDVPWTLPSSSLTAAPITGYEVQTKTGTNWQTADGGLVSGSTTTLATLGVTPWTSIYVRVAPVTEYDTANSRSWSTYGGEQAQAFQVAGFITMLSHTVLVAATEETITVTGAGFSSASTKTVEFKADLPVLKNGATGGKSSVTLPATVLSPTRIQFKYPGASLPRGVKNVAATVSVNGANSMKSNVMQVNLTGDEVLFDLGLDTKGAKFSPKITTTFTGSLDWSLKAKNGEKIFSVKTCSTYKTVKGKKTCVKFKNTDSASCYTKQVLPANKKAVLRTVVFKSPCLLSTLGKKIMKSDATIDVTATRVYTKTYPTTGLNYVLVKGKKTGIMKPTKKAYLFHFGNMGMYKGW